MTVTKHKLKKGEPGFQVADGPMSGVIFEPNMVYVAIPAAYAGRFEPVEVAVPGPEDDEPETKKGRRAKA